jgi:hypothetical protein
MEDLDEEILAMVSTPAKQAKRRRKKNSDDGSDYGSPQLVELDQESEQDEGEISDPEWDLVDAYP